MKRPRRKPLDRIFRGVRLSVVAGVQTAGEWKKRDQMLTHLRDTDRFDLWCAIAQGRLKLPEVYTAYQTGRLHLLSGDLALHQDLVEAVEAWLPTSAPAKATRERYRVSWAELVAVGVLPRGAKVRALEAIDWRGLKARWTGGPHDWKHLRGFVSHFLSVQLGDTWHPFRRRVMATFPTAPQTHRVPDLTPEVFWQLVPLMPEPIRAVPVALLMTAMRIGELCACTESHLLPLTQQVRIPSRTLNRSEFKSEDTTQPVDARMWPWLVRAIPVPVSHWTVRDHWRAACRQLGVTATLHDLRHCHGQWLINAGRSEESVQRSLRHKTASVTRQYVTQRDRQSNAVMIADILIESHEKPHRASTQQSSREAQGA